eukprot:scaffold3080_cov78-Isochrysis_galbana.AAC.3
MVPGVRGAAGARPASGSSCGRNPHPKPRGHRVHLSRAPQPDPHRKTIPHWCDLGTEPLLPRGILTM